MTPEINQLLSSGEISLSHIRNFLDLVRSYLDAKKSFNDGDLRIFRTLVQTVFNLVLKSLETFIFRLKSSNSNELQKNEELASFSLEFDEIYRFYRTGNLKNETNLVGECVRVLWSLFSLSIDSNSLSSLSPFLNLQFSGKLIWAFQKEIRILLFLPDSENFQQNEKHVLNIFFNQINSKNDGPNETESKIEKTILQNNSSQNKTSPNLEIVQKSKIKNKEKGNWGSGTRLDEFLAGNSRIESEWAKMIRTVRKLEIGAHTFSHFEKTLKMSSNLPEMGEKSFRPSKVKMTLPNSKFSPPLESKSNQNTRELRLKKEAELNLEAFLND